MLTLVTGCAAVDNPVSMAPALQCPDEVKCHAFVWRIGFFYGPQVAGAHLVCRCRES